jgi:hypothetical protein
LYAKEELIISAPRSFFKRYLRAKEEESNGSRKRAKSFKGRLNVLCVYIVECIYTVVVAARVDPLVCVVTALARAGRTVVAKPMTS